MASIPATNPEKSSVLTGRFSKKLRHAINEMAREGCSQREAARRAGMNETALGRAIKKPYVAAELDALKASVATNISAMEGHYRILALEHAWYLAKNAASEAVQARMVELLAGETKKSPQINVQTNVFTPGANGYEYLPPGSQIVDITPVEHGSEGAGIGDGDSPSEPAEE